MRSLFNYIITTENRYNNKIGDLVVNTEITERDAIFVNRVGTIIATPSDSNFGSLPIGATVIVHHNVFRRMVGMQGKEQNSTSHIEDDKYLVYADQIFAYKEGKEWKACEGYCFVEPRENEETFINGHLALLSGYMRYPDDNLVQQGIKEGDLVGFSPNSEYEFTIDNQKLYRINSNQIYGYKENASKETRSS